MMTSKPVISVFTLCYNNSENVINTLEAIKNQTYSEIDHIILDDASIDNSVEKLNNWIEINNYDCRFIKNKKNIGICKSLNKILQVADGEFVAINCDDYWEPFHLEKSLEILNNSNADAIYSKTKMCTTDGEYILNIENALTRHDYPRFKNLFNSEDDYFIISKTLAIDALFYLNYLHIISLVISKEKIVALGGFNEKLPFEDYDMNFKICNNLKVCFNQSFEATYFQHKKSYTVNFEFRQRLLWGISMTLANHKKLITYSDTELKIKKSIYGNSIEILRSNPKYFFKILNLHYKTFTKENKIFTFLFFATEISKTLKIRFVHKSKRILQKINRA